MQHARIPARIPVRIPTRTAARLGAMALVLAVMGTVGAPAGAALAATADGSPTTAASLELIVDGSGSMAAADPSGGTKIKAAKAALAGVADALPAGSTVAVRAYGGRYADDDPRACRDTRLVVPLGPLSASVAKASVAGLQPLGQTPIATSLLAAATDLGRAGSRTIVLISDGQETCGGKPCDVARSLARQGVGLTVDTVGYGADAATAADLQCIAAATGGTYLPAADGVALAAQLRHLSARALRAYDPEGTPVTGALEQATPPVLVPGQYLDTLAAGQTKSYALDLARGVTPYVATTLVRPAGPIAGAGTGSVLDSNDAVESRLLNPAGQDCNVFGRGNGDQSRGGVPTTAVLDVPTMDTEWFTGCGAPGRYVLTVKRDATPTKQGNAVLPLELRFIAEPPVSDPDSLPAPAAGGDLAAPSVLGTATPVSAGGSYNSAPLVAPGLYSDDIQPGETLYYRVHTDWGQRLNVALGAPHTPDTTQPDVVSALTVELSSPVRSRLSTLDGHGESTVFSSRGSETATLHAVTPPVTFRNRSVKSPLDQTVSSLAGDWYVALHLDYRSNDGLRVPFHLAVQVSGPATGAPAYGAVATSPAPTASAPVEATSAPADATTAPVEVTSAPAVSPAAPAPSVPAPSVPAPSAPLLGLSSDIHPDHTGRTVGLAAGGALAILLAAGITLPLLRRRR